MHAGCYAARHVMASERVPAGEDPSLATPVRVAGARAGGAVRWRRRLHALRRAQPLCRTVDEAGGR